MSINKRLAYHLRKARLDKDWTQEYASNRIDVSPRTWVTWETTGEIPNRRVEELATLFEKDVSWFFQDVESLPKEHSPAARAKKKAA